MESVTANWQDVQYVLRSRTIIEPEPEQHTNSGTTKEKVPEFPATVFLANNTINEGLMLHPQRLKRQIINAKPTKSDDSSVIYTWNLKKINGINSCTQIGSSTYQI